MSRQLTGKREWNPPVKTQDLKEREPAGRKIAVLKIRPWFYLWIATLY